MDSRIAEILAKNETYCSHGDTVNYADPPKVFESCDGSFLFDENDTPYLDLQMWYSAVNFGYRNKRISDVLRKQIDKLPQLASQYLHREKVELAEILCKYMEDKHGVKGRVHFNVGGAQAVEDAFGLETYTFGLRVIATAAVSDTFPIVRILFHSPIVSAAPME